MRVCCVRRLACTVSFGLLVLGLAWGCSRSPAPVADSVAAASDASAEPLPNADTMRDELDEVLKFTLDRKMSAEEHAAWQVVHGVLAFGRPLKIRAAGQDVTALDYLLEGGELLGWNLRPGDAGLEAIVEAGTKTGQGHEDQWLGYLSQVGIPLEQSITVGGRQFKVVDMVRQAQADVYDGMEATWTLMAFSSYLSLDATWKSRDGSDWSVERLVAMEAGQDLNASACGGSHRLYGLTTMLNRYLAEGGKLQGGWAAADAKIQEAIALARQHQQPDGSLSSSYFARATASSDIALRMNTTGHVLEFLVLAMTDQQVREPWVTRAVWRLCDMFRQTRDLPVECGSLYHAAHGLALYRTRLYGMPDYLAQPADASARPQPSTPQETTAAVDRPVDPAEATVTP